MINQVTKKEVDDYVKRHDAPIIRTIYKLTIQSDKPQETKWRWLRAVIDEDLHPGDPRLSELKL